MLGGPFWGPRAGQEGEISTTRPLGAGQEDELECFSVGEGVLGAGPAWAKARSDTVFQFTLIWCARDWVGQGPGPGDPGSPPEAPGALGPVRRGREGYWEAPGEPSAPRPGQRLPHQSCCGCWLRASWAVAGAGRVHARQLLAPCPYPCQPWEPH